MKKRICSLFLALCLVLSLTGTVFAAQETGTITTQKDTTITGFDGSIVTFGDSGNQDKVTVTYRGSALKPGEQYLVLMLADADANPENPEGSIGTLPDANNILYIDQKAADQDGSITFEVYPKSLTTGVILITGVDKSGKPQKLIAAIVKAQFILGDIDGNGAVNGADLTEFNKRMSGLIPEFVGSTFLAADLDKNNKVNGADLTYFNQYFSGIIKSLETLK